MTPPTLEALVIRMREQLMGMGSRLAPMLRGKSGRVVEAMIRAEVVRTLDLMETAAHDADKTMEAAPVDPQYLEASPMSTVVVYDNGMASVFDEDGAQVPALSGPWVLARSHILTAMFREPQGPRSIQFHIGLPYPATPPGGADA